MRFYFTYGSEGQPFSGGWTLVHAPDIKVAQEIFRAYHPDKELGVLNRSSVYTHEQFMKARMAGPHGNFGYRCHEMIAVVRNVFSE